MKDRDMTERTKTCELMRQHRFFLLIYLTHVKSIVTFVHQQYIR